MFDRLLQWTGLKAKKTLRPASTRPATTKARPIHVTDTDFDARILGNEKLVVVDFWADWCGPCHQMSPHIGFLAEAYSGRLDIG